MLDGKIDNQQTIDHPASKRRIQRNKGFRAVAVDRL